MLIIKEIVHYNYCWPLLKIAAFCLAVGRQGWAQRVFSFVSKILTLHMSICLFQMIGIAWFYLKPQMMTLLRTSMPATFRWNCWSDLSFLFVFYTRFMQMQFCMDRNGCQGLSCLQLKLANELYFTAVFPNAIRGFSSVGLILATFIYCNEYVSIFYFTACISGLQWFGQIYSSSR